MKVTKISYFCDNKDCKKEIALEDSIAIEMQFTYGSTYVSHVKGIHKIEKHICSKCAERLGITRKVVQEDKIVPEVLTTAEQLYNIIAQVAWETPGRAG